MDTSISLSEGDDQLQVIKSSTAQEFLDNIRPKSSQIGPPDFSDPWVYRGHYDAAWDLLPHAWRKDGQEKLRPLRGWLSPRVRQSLVTHPHYQEWTDEHRESCFRRSLQIVTEVFAVRQFCDLADELGIRIPNENEVPELGSTIPQATLDFVPVGIMLARVPLFIDIPFAFAQHHGIPTRYMDWTRDPFVAAFFATEESKGEKISDDICVWAADYTAAPNWGTATGSRPERLEWVRIPRADHSFVHAQSGVFLLCGNRAGDGWRQMPRIPTKKYTLPRRESENLRTYLLGSHRVSKAHLMPTLDNVMAVTNEKWKWLPK
jgi:hypothetical protein